MHKEFCKIYIITFDVNIPSALIAPIGRLPCLNSHQDTGHLRERNRSLLLSVEHIMHFEVVRHVITQVLLLGPGQGHDLGKK